MDEDNFADLDSAGRFFANHLLKLLLSQIVMRYDIKHDTEPRPQNPVSYTHLAFYDFGLSVS
jgi:hypothetical protein